MLFLAKKIQNKMRNVTLAFVLMGLLFLILAIAIWMLPQLIVVLVVAGLIIMALTSFGAAIKVAKVKGKIDNCCK